MALLLALLPLSVTGPAMLAGRLYGPADLYGGWPPWGSAGSGAAAAPAVNPILSDVAFANLPWRAAVRDALANGRLPFWNRFVLCGTPLLAAAQAGVFHPSTWAGILLPLPLSWTFSCTFTLFLALLGAYVWLRDFRLASISCAVGAAAWGLSTYIAFWNGWSVGPATASLPLLLLGLRRIARGGAHGVGLAVTGFLLGFFGGHPESTLHTTLAAAVYFAWELASAPQSRILPALGRAAGAGILALLLGAPQLLPLAEAIPHSAEYRSRRSGLEKFGGRQSVPARDAASRLVPAVLPFAHGIYGKSPVQGWRQDGSGMPLAYSGALLFPLAGLGLFSRRFRERGRLFLAGAVVAGLLLGASAPGLIDTLTALPGFSLALNYRLVFLASLGLAGLAAFGAEEARRGAPLALACVLVLAALAAAYLAASPVLRERGLPREFVAAEFALEAIPTATLALVAFAVGRGRAGILAPAALLLLIAQRGLELRNLYPTLHRDSLAPLFPGLESLSSREPSRIVGIADALRPNVAALYGLEDARGYESIVLARLADTFPLWSEPQLASHNRIDRLDRPFLDFLNVRFAAAAPESEVARGWTVRARTRALAVLENPGALPRCFVPSRVRAVSPARALSEMRVAREFASVVWVASASDRPEAANGPATLRVRESGSDLVITTSSAARVLVATSVPDWPGWSARSGHGAISTVTVDHAFVGFWAPAGESRIRLTYVPPFWPLAVAALAVGLAACATAAIARRRPLA